MARVSVRLALLAALLVSSTCSKNSPAPTSPTSNTPARAAIAAAVGNVAGEKTNTGHTYRFQVTVRETAGVAATVTTVTMAFFNGATQFASVTRNADLPFTTIAAGSSASANWTVTDDNGGHPYATRVLVTITFTDSTGPQTATASADVPPLPQPPSTMTVCGRVKEGSMGVADAHVQIVGSSRSTNTDGQGRYCFSDVASGSLTLRVSKAGFNTLEQTILVTGPDLPDLDLSRVSAPPPSPAPTITSFTADSTSITAGQSTTLRWSVSGATTVSIDNGIGTVSATGNRSISPTQSTTYRLTATNNSGTSDRTVMVSVGSSTPPPPGSIPICSFPTPPGVTAVCNNGNFSMSQNRSGTCSSNQGVQCWVCPGPLCTP